VVGGLTLRSCSKGRRRRPGNRGEDSFRRDLSRKRTLHRAFTRNTPHVTESPWTSRPRHENRSTQQGSCSFFPGWSQKIGLRVESGSKAGFPRLRGETARSRRSGWQGREHRLIERPNSRGNQRPFRNRLPDVIVCWNHKLARLPPAPHRGSSSFHLIQVLRQIPKKN